MAYNVTTLEWNSILLIYLLAFAGLAFGGYNVWAVTKVKPVVIAKKFKKNQLNIQNNEETSLSIEEEDSLEFTQKQLDDLIFKSTKISTGADVFLKTEYMYLSIFVAAFAILVFFVAEHQLWTAYVTVAFLVGAGTSMLCGFIGMKIATATNYRTTYSAFYGLGEAFKTAYHGGCVMGFILVSLSVTVLMSLILIYKAIYLNLNSPNSDFVILFESIAGYGLGGSLVALFCRVGGGIYTKAADVGADLVKIEYNIEEDHPQNPAVIADNVGDNVGDIAGMGSDLFGSLAEGLTAALLVGSTSIELITNGASYYPILIISFGIAISIITAMVAIISADYIKTYFGLEWTIKLQLIISSALLIPAIALISIYSLPKSYSVGEVNTILYKKDISNAATMVCPILGLISGLLIGLSTEFFTSMSFTPVKRLVESCKSGAAINIILGLAYGYMSNIIPTILIALTVFGSFSIAGMYGIALSALGMLSNLPIALAIDGYGPISDNAGGLASMCELDERIRDTTDQLDSAGNTTAAIGKGFAIGSACLVALSLFGAFVTRTNVGNINALTPVCLFGLIIGAMLPYLFSALTMQAVGRAANKMLEQIRKDINLTDPNHEVKSENCIDVATTYSLSQMFLPGIIIIFVPIIFGVLFGPVCVGGLLIGIIISGIQMAISAANSGGAWDNAKKSIKNYGLPIRNIERIEIDKDVLNLKLKDLENGIGIISEEEREREIQDIKDQIITLEANISYYQQNESHKDNAKFFFIKDKKIEIYKLAEQASIIGDTVGDPLKDTSGPSLNILIKLSSIISVIFGTVFVNTAWLKSWT